jgi:hypothetical protein
MIAVRSILCLVAVATIACDDNPDERTLLQAPRLLAVRAEPPVLRGVDGVVTLSALAVSTEGAYADGQAVQYRACNPWAFMVSPERDCPPETSLQLGNGELTTEQLFAFYPPPEGQGYNPGDGGVPQESCEEPASIEVPILAEVEIDGVSLVTVKRIPIFLDESARQNPSIDTIAVVATNGDERTLSIEVDPSSLDQECRDGARQLEAVRIYLYSTSGSFESSSVDVVPTPGGRIEPAEIRWTSAGESAILFFVVIDNEGGVDWRTRTLEEGSNE